MSLLLDHALRNLSRNRRRTLMVLLTVAFGAAGLFGFQGLNNGMLSQYKRNTIRAKYGHGELFRKGFRERVREKPWTYWIQDYPHVRDVLKQQPEVAHVFPRITFPALLSSGRVTLTGLGTGIDGAEEDRFFNLLNIVDGAPTGGDRSRIVLGKGLAESLGVKVGDTVQVLSSTVNGTMNASNLVVSGIFHMGAKEVDDHAFRLELAEAQSLLDTSGVESVALGLNSDDAWGNVAKVVDHELPGIEAVPFEVLDWVYYGNSVKWLGSQFGFFRGIILLIVLLGIFNTVSASIMDRKEEFGFLRANGETRTRLFALVASEALLLGVLGAALGLALTWVLNVTVLAHGLEMPPAPGFTRPFGFHLELGWTAAGQVLLLASLTALAGTVLAGVKVLRLGIAELMRAS